MSPSKIEYQPLIRDMSPEERPREKLQTRGASNLSNAELLAIILRTGSASDSVLALATRLLAKFGGLGGLVNASFGELCDVTGIGPAKACQVQAALQLGKNLDSLKLPVRDVVKCPEDVFKLVKNDMGFLEQEELRVVLLNSRNQVIKIQPICTGTINTAAIRVAEVFKLAIRENSPALVVVHNHPSGDPSPSQDDIKVTREMVAAGKLLGIDVLDHMVIGRQEFVSLKEKGMGFE